MLKHLALSLQFGQLKDVARHRAALPRHKVARWIRHSLDADAVRTHNGRHFFPILVQYSRAHALRVFTAQFEDVANLYSFPKPQRLVADRVEFPFKDIADVGGCRNREVP